MMKTFLREYANKSLCVSVVIAVVGIVAYVTGTALWVKGGLFIVAIINLYLIIISQGMRRGKS